MHNYEVLILTLPVIHHHSSKFICTLAQSIHYNCNHCTNLQNKWFTKLSNCIVSQISHHKPGNQAYHVYFEQYIVLIIKHVCYVPHCMLSATQISGTWYHPKKIPCFLRNLAASKTCVYRISEYISNNTNVKCNMYSRNDIAIKTCVYYDQ